MYKKINKVRFYGWWLVRFVAKMTISMALSVFAKPSGKYDNLWLIMELPKEARDNGYWLYKYIVENHPDINVRYVLAKDSPDYDKMPAKENIIRPYSWQHYISYIHCKYSVSSHIYGTSPGRYYSKLFRWLLPRKAEVFLQHGVTKEVIPLRGFSDWTVIVSPTEIQHFINSGHTHPERLLQTGFCRYDSLVDVSNRQKRRIILVMPTFRSWLGGHVTVGELEFRKSDYYREWRSVLTNEKLNKLAKKNNYKVVFYPHRQMQGFMNLFRDIQDENIEIASHSTHDVQTLLRQASLLVTDYSSVFYDFSYMKKPVLFYPFDKKRYYTDHHSYSGAPYPFGEFYDNEDSLVRAIRKYAERDFEISAKASKEVDDFFIYKDRHNSQRNFEAIKSLEY